MSQFTIYSASAGAGKTYRLVRDYLRISLGSEHPGEFMRILAITFTNKAANEMKGRIIRQLRELAEFEEGVKEPTMLPQLCDDLKLSASAVCRRARACLSSILHQYSAFSVSTIDGFTNRLIRSFARDLQVSGNYEVEMENDEMLAEAIDDLLAGLDEDQDTTALILGFVEEQLEQGRSPHPDHNLMEAGRNLFREEALAHIRRLRGISPQEYLDFIGELRTRTQDIENRVKQNAEKILAFVHEAGLGPEHFNRGTVYNYLLYLANGLTDKWIPGKMVQQVLNGEANFYAKSKRAEMEPLFAPVEQDLHDMLLRLLALIEEHYAEHHLSQQVLRNVYGTAVISEIDRRLQKVKEDTNRLPIGEFNKLISEKLMAEPAEYLFERLGEKYRYFFIDEFQDTSRLQWQNLLPLINNAMASGGEVMLVGDAKQSIYRWRGGEVEQFLDLRFNRDPSNKTEANGQIIELYQRHTHSLPTNYRSRQEVVKFNNRFFKEAAKLIAGSDFRELYENSRQDIHHEAGGYVNLRILPYDSDDKNAYIEEQCHNCLGIIDDARSRDYEYRDITILVRSNQNGSLLAEYLLANNIPVISPDALSLVSSRAVRALVSGLEVLNQPTERSLRYNFLDYLYELPLPRQKYPDKHLFMAETCSASPAELFAHLSELLPGFKLGHLHSLALSDLAYEICRLLAIDVQQNPFMHAFMDELRSFELREGEDLPAFIRWWREKGSDKNISTPAQANAVQIMSIHKSKGLEFRICILAFADWGTESEPGVVRKWLGLEDADFLALPSAWINLKKDDSQLTIPAYRQLYEHNKRLVNFDNINLLYVAFTRAEEELYVLGTNGHRDKNQRVYRYLHHFMEQHDTEHELEFGAKTLARAIRRKPISRFPGYSTESWTNKLRVVAEAPTQWREGEINAGIAAGKAMHGLLALIREARDIEEALRAEFRAGNIGEKDLEPLRQSLDKIVSHPQLRHAFRSGVEIFNEVEILQPGGRTARPDRVVIVDGRADIIDYKTGLARPEHREQLNQYRQLLTDMGYGRGNNILAYLGNQIEIEQWQGS